MKRLLMLIFGIILFYTFWSCSKNTEPKRISENTFVQIYCDVATYADIIESKSRQAFVDSIFTHYDVTEESFNITKESFSNDPQKWKEVFEQIVEELEKRKKEFETKSGTERKETAQNKNEA